MTTEKIEGDDFHEPSYFSVPQPPMTTHTGQLQIITSRETASITVRDPATNRVVIEITLPFWEYSEALAHKRVLCGFVLGEEAE